MKQLWVFLAYICLIYNKYCSLLYKICLNWLQFWVFNENSNMFINTQIKWFQTTKKQLRKFFLLSCQTGLNNKTKVQTFSMEINNNHIKQPTHKIKTHFQYDLNNIKKFKIINLNNILYKKCNFFLKISFNISDLISYIYNVKIINFSFFQADF